MENKSNYDKLKAESIERVKELSTINRTTSILKEGKPIGETLQGIVHILAEGWQFPEYTQARIIYNTKEYKSNDFKVTGWVQKQSFETIDKIKGSIEIYYTQSFPSEYEGPFLKEERDLIANLANIISGYLNAEKGKWGMSISFRFVLPVQCLC